ncbi:unnamed protein product [Ilex paraguariensis]|uniref:Uncharacterized protein n=1 Tax=Ilex paraguariensis TaxID=185542 RepID=A0ABC8TA34_9AQUA
MPMVMVGMLGKLASHCDIVQINAHHSSPISPRDQKPDEFLWEHEECSQKTWGIRQLTGNVLQVYSLTVITCAGIPTIHDINHRIYLLHLVRWIESCILTFIDSIDVISSSFDGQSVVNRQRMVYKAIWEELQNTVHAVDQMTTRTPTEAASEK